MTLAATQLGFAFTLGYWDTPQSGGAGPSGQLKTLASPDSVTCSFAYDGPLLASQAWSGLVSGTVSRTFDNAFRDSLETVSVGAATSTVRFSYDADGLLTQAAAVPTGWVLDVHRADSTGLVDSTAVGSGAGQVTSSASYNAHGELVELHYSLAGSPLFHQSIQHDVLGRVTRVEERWYGGATRVLAYGHDLAGRLDSVAVAGAVHRRYEYDGGTPGNGNRTAERDGSGSTLASATHDAQDRMLTYGPAAYSYTANGELARRIVGTDTTRYTYDALGSLTGVRLANGDSLKYVIDGQGRRVGRKSNGVMQRGWLYSNSVTPVAELDSTGALLNRYVHGTLWHAPDLVLRGDTAHRVVTDHLGSIRAVVRTSDGLVVQRREYDAWGVITADTAGAFQSLGYAGGLTDSATGLVRFGARDYEPQVGRWTTKDPIGFAGGDANLYAYVASSPTSSADPAGFARIGSRRLRGQPGMFPNPRKPKGTVGGILDACDCELLHEQLFYEDGSGQNVGWGPEGYISEESIEDYVMETVQYDDAAMKETERVVRKMRNFYNYPYTVIGNNCQMFMSQLRFYYPFVKAAKAFR